MAHIPWQRRIRRAERLAAEHPFAAEILAFYIHTARFQQDVYRQLERAFAGNASYGSAGVPQAVERASRLLPGQQHAGATLPPELLSRFPDFLALVEKQAPARLANVAAELSQSPDIWADLLHNFWTATGQVPSESSQFLALAFLQPYAEFIRARAALQLEGYTHALCPFCGRQPALGVLRPQGDGARRSLLCGFCLCEWEFRRIVCPGCGEEDHAKLPVYTAETFPYIRVECCDSCRTYIKSIDLSKNGLAEPLVDELASVPLDLWAQEHGYAKLHPNLLGL